MGRQPKKGLDFFRKDVDTWDDFKIMDLVDKYGPMGYAVYDVMLCIVYSHGYYLEGSLDQLAALIMRKIGNRWIEDKKLVQEVIQYCAELGLIDKALLARSVVTSEGIQKRYSEVTARKKVDKSKYWLIDNPEDQSEDHSEPEEIISATEKDISATEKNISATGKDISATGKNISATEIPVSAAKMQQSKVKEKKEKERKGNESKVCSRFVIPCRKGSFPVSEEMLSELTHTYPNMNVEDSLNKLCSYLSANPHRQPWVSSADGYIRMWLLDDDVSGKYRKKPADNGYAAAYDLSEYEQSSVLDYFDDDGNGNAPFVHSDNSE